MKRALFSVSLALFFTATNAYAGDFVHQPPIGQRPGKPLPLYAEIESKEVARVVVKYRNSSMTSFRRLALHRSRSGWGAYLPCADLEVGSIRYYLQGFDRNGELIASSGDPDHAFEVSIRPDFVGEPAPVPGERAPACGNEDAPRPEPIEPGGERPRAHYWIGVAGTLDLSIPPSANEVCPSASGYWCTTPEGADLPASPALVQGNRGTTNGDLTPGSVHIVATFDYAATGNLLVGARLGYVANAYPGDAASAAGKTLGARLHLEARATWVIGDEPIARSGLSPYVFGSLGAARFDTPVTVMVTEQGVAGQRAVRAWHVAGPAFAALGGGARYAFSPRIAFAAGLGAYAAVAPGAFGFEISPELNFNVGF